MCGSERRSLAAEADGGRALLRQKNCLSSRPSAKRESRDPYSAAYRWFCGYGSRLFARFARSAGTTERDRTPSPRRKTEVALYAELSIGTVPRVLFQRQRSCRRRAFMSFAYSQSRAVSAFFLGHAHDESKTSPPEISSSGRGCCRAVGRVAFGKRAKLSCATRPRDRALCSRWCDRHVRAADHAKA